ncbi:hypothetical protein [Streptomyces eurythermus]
MIDEHQELLAGLDEVDWVGLSHAYGSAEDVPGRIRALCGIDGQARQEALQSLSNSISTKGRVTTPPRTWCRSWPASRWPDRLPPARAPCGC